MGDDTSGAGDVHQVGGELPFHLLTGLAHEVVRRMVYRQRKPDAPLHGPSEEDLEELCRALMAGNDAAMAEDIVSALAENTSTEMIYLQYLAPAARKLGDWWEEDEASFLEVTTATGRIFELLRKLSADTHMTSGPQELTVVFASVPGEQHTLGVRMAADLFRGEGWEIALKIGLSKAELIAEIKKLPRCIVALSIGGRHSREELFDVVAELRIHCPQAAIVVCGKGTEDTGASLSAMGLDSVDREVNQAKKQFLSLWYRESAIRRL